MEHLQFAFEGGNNHPERRPAQIVGVVASGNLEVLIESAPADPACRVEVNTAANGFGRIWEAVLQDFFERHSLSHVRISINDAGATPAIVTLRLDQAVESYARGRIR